MQTDGSQPKSGDDVSALDASGHEPLRLEPWRPSRHRNLTPAERREEAIKWRQLRYDMARRKVHSPYHPSLGAIRSTSSCWTAYCVVPWQTNFFHLRRATYVIFWRIVYRVSGRV
jgi:hypothetical protein